MTVSILVHPKTKSNIIQLVLECNVDPILFN